MLRHKPSPLRQRTKRNRMARRYRRTRRHHSRPRSNLEKQSNVHWRHQMKLMRLHLLTTSHHHKSETTRRNRPRCSHLLSPRTSRRKSTPHNHLRGEGADTEETGRTSLARIMILALKWDVHPSHRDGRRAYQTARPLTARGLPVPDHRAWP
ncbi:hypothetical protein CH063_11727 [Colletotrichum higginsianum]|uniref:Uncharacterized protein n=1 Tax=Colletotrichum higginsianum (strain IMI 349063) TaxID=759273 RepID=H1VMK7_COLHI|nr:hypothetical protein CH063_11727 [Colletotrichum higginsianum]